MTAPTRVCPPLIDGDRLTRAEFERRYDAMPELKKAELIDGVVHMPSPVSFDRHASPHAHIVTWLGVYLSQTPGVRLGDNGTVRLTDDTEVQPDGLLLIFPGGQATIDSDDYILGSPEFVAEVAASSASVDRHAKLRAYQRAGVREYLLWRVDADVIDWLVLRNGTFQPLSAGVDGVLRSEAFPGLWLDAAALRRGDLAAVLAMLQRGLATPEHGACPAFARPERRRAAAMTAPTRVCPPLVNGDRLSRAEFERRYDAMPELKKAELIDGVVHMPSPVSFSRHSSPHAALIGWLITYQAHTPGVSVGDNGTVRLTEDTEVQPDGLLLIHSGGQATIDADDFVSGAPELVAEVAASSASVDRHAKLRAYQHAGVREYLLWRVDADVIDWLVLRGGAFQPLTAGPDGVLRSEAFPGLWLDPATACD
ncbi:MAG: Uma2 family endonuclease [Gemmataceae bacterium]